MFKLFLGGIIFWTFFSMTMGPERILAFTLLSASFGDLVESIVSVSLIGRFCFILFFLCG